MVQRRLQRQLWLAGLLLFASWLITLAVNVPLLHHRPVVFFALLPGFLVAVHVQWQLSGHLRDNHVQGEEDRPFPTLGAANWITLGRTAGVVTLAGFLPMVTLTGHGLPQSLSWAPGLVYLGIALADLLDGAVARRQHRVTELGKRLDIVTDAAGLLIASLLAVGLGRLPAIYLLVGLAYYSFIFGIWWRRKRGLPLVALQPRPYARILAGLQMGLVGVALLPLLHRQSTAIAAYIFMMPLLLGFLRDWLVVSCRAATDGNQQTAWEIMIGGLWTERLPLLLRLIIVITGLAILTAPDHYQAPHLWQVALGMGCLLTGCGLMGRSAALILSLLLGSNLSPFGTSIPAMVLFIAAVTLLLTGTGTWSLWAPEENLLYRRNGKKMTPCGATR